MFPGAGSSHLKAHRWILMRVAFSGLLVAAPGIAQPQICGNPPGASISYLVDLLSDESRSPNCQNFFNCYCPEKVTGPVYEVSPPGCQGTSQSCTVTVRVGLKFPGSAQNTFIGTHPQVYWFKHAQPTVPCNAGSCDFVGQCGPLGAELLHDRGETYLTLGSLTCNSLRQAQGAGVYSFSAYSCYRLAGGQSLPPPGNSCATSPCEKRLDVENLDLSVPKLMALLGCPPENGCPDDQSCSTCTGPGGGTSVGGGPPGIAPPSSGPGAQLRYLARGVGHPNFPGSPAWNASLGRYWAHDYAQRIVSDTADQSHVWLLTRFGTFREFYDLDVPSGIYATRQPGDEKRRLRRLGSGGWELTELDGTVHLFGTGGLWLSTTDRNGNAKTAQYTGTRLDSVQFPDGRSETFGYDVNGRLQTITEVGVATPPGPAPTRTWTYTWSGLDLTRIGRPDGTAWEMTYGNATFPGYLTQLELVGTDSSRRIEGVWEYDGSGNVARTWRGASTFAGGVDRWALAFDDVVQPKATTATDAFGVANTFELDRDSGTTKPKPLKITGDCPTCTSGPNSRFVYGDAANPMRPTVMFDGRNLRTEMDYDGNGQMTARREAVGTSKQRETTYSFSSAFPALMTSMAQPSTAGGGAQRVETHLLDAHGNIMTRRLQGVEAGSAFLIETATVYNSAGQPLTIDPPGFGSVDATQFSYDVPGRNGLIADSRTDPLDLGVTGFEYDGWNRRIRTVDANGVGTETQYDLLNRVLSVRQEGSGSVGDLLTTYEYTPFGDLKRTTLPAGNVVEYGYDSAGRMVTVERKPNAASPGERTLYTLNPVGQRTKEELQRWNGTAWETRSSSEFTYSSRCHLDRVDHPDGSSTEYRYDCAGNLEKVWDANHPVATNPVPTQAYAYDELNRLTSVAQPWAGAGGGTAITQYEYDVQDHLTRITDANANVTTATTSDRGLMTAQSSPVAASSTYAYNPHGQMTQETDARPVTVTRTVDGADRVTLIQYPDPALQTTFTYGTSPTSFNVGRLISVARPNSVINYAYDRFGRITQDGAMSYQLDANGNRTTLTYPLGVQAQQTFDFADRPRSLTLLDGANPPQPLALNAVYEPFGPLASLSLGNGLAEQRTYTTRYFPQTIQLPGRLSWSYATDKLGNPTAISDLLTPASSRTYTYLDSLYFLTSGVGPWGNWSWSYDKIGNRLSETKNGALQNYTYVQQGAPPQNTPKLATRGAIAYGYDAIGNLTSANTLQLTWDDARNLRQLGIQGLNSYDGRGFLAQLSNNGGADAVTATYGSEGQLFHRHDLRGGGVFTSDTWFFDFGGRPLASLEKVVNNGTPQTLLRFYTTDHLNTPVVATDAAGAVTWTGGFDPFGGDSFSSAQKLKSYHRFPGQWQDNQWYGFSKFADFSYNLHRWYDSATGRYTAPDPLSLSLFRGVEPPTGFTQTEAYVNSLVRAGNPKFEMSYGYAVQNPLSSYDPDGRVLPLACLIPPLVAALEEAIVLTVTVVSATAAGVTVADWWNERRSCEQCKIRDTCLRLLEMCLVNTTQPGWNRPLFGSRKDCGACFRQCKNSEGAWPFDKCPLP